jgi:hypothetical protein
MSQNDLVIANQSFPSFRTDLNSALQAINTSQSGTSRPSGAVAGTIWLDTTSATTPTLKYYDGADDISLATIDHTANTVNWLDSTVSVTGLSTTATGTVLTLSDSATTSTVNLIIDNDKEIRFREATANGTNYISLSAPTSLSADVTYTLPTAPASNNRALISSTAGVMSYTPYSFPSSDGSANQLLKTDGAGALSFTSVSSGSLPFKNLFINGDMQIAQRSTSVASITTDGYYTVDRMKFLISSLGTFTQSQSTDVPTGQGFSKSLKLDCTTADASPSAGDYIVLQQLFEGQNLQYLKKGTASALSLTASFWVKSTKTGTFISNLYDSSNARSVSKSYTVNTTNTWEFKTVTFPADTTGTFTNDNSNALALNFWLGAGTDFTSGTLNTTWESSTTANRAVGQVNIADSTSNDWLITGVQLEAGTSATDFEFLPIDVSLGRCQRYYYQFVNGNNQMVGSGAYISSTRVDVNVFFPVQMRVNPTFVQSTGSNYYYVVYNGAVDYFDAWTAVTSETKNGTFLYVTSGVSGAAGAGTTSTTSNASSSLAFDSEL